jgi:hypothetical protein
MCGGLPVGGEAVQFRRVQRGVDLDVFAVRQALCVDLPPGHGAHQALGHAHVPVGLRVGGDLVGPVGAEGPVRNAPAKNTRIMCVNIAATKISAAQWWICLMSSPPRTSKLMRSVEAYAWDIDMPCNGTYRP